MPLLTSCDNYTVILYHLAKVNQLVSFKLERFHCTWYMGPFHNKLVTLYIG